LPPQFPALGLLAIHSATGLRFSWILFRRSSRPAHLSCFSNTLFVALFESRDVGHALSDSSWVNVMHEELENFERNQIWILVDPPRDVNIIGTK
jgi:hypothetical protein